MITQGSPKGKAWLRYWAYFKAPKRELDGKIVLFRDKSICHPAWLDKLGVNMHFRQFLGVICAKNLCESVISSPTWGTPSGIVLEFCITLKKNTKLKYLNVTIFFIEYFRLNAVTFLVNIYIWFIYRWTKTEKYHCLILREKSY